jgi:hypothetical protein
MTVPGVAGRGVPLAVVVVMMPCNARGTKTTSTAPGGLAGQGGSARERTNTRQRRTAETRHRAAVRALTSPTRQACNALKEWLTTLFFASVTTSVALFFVAVMAVRMRRWPRGRTPQLRLHCRLQLPAPFASASFFALAHRALIFPSPGSHRCDPENIQTEYEKVSTTVISQRFRKGLHEQKPSGGGGFSHGSSPGPSFEIGREQWRPWRYARCSSWRWPSRVQTIRLLRPASCSIACARGGGAQCVRSASLHVVVHCAGPSAGECRAMCVHFA